MTVRWRRLVPSWSISSVPDSAGLVHGPDPLSPFLRPEPSFRDLVAAGQQIILVRAGDILIIRQLHPPALGFFTLQESGLHFRKGSAVFNKKISVRQRCFPPAPAFPIYKIPQHMADLAGRQLSLIPGRQVSVNTYGIDIMTKPRITHKYTGLFAVETIRGKLVGRSKRMSDRGNIEAE
jgi:hypothetical protein